MKGGCKAKGKQNNVSTVLIVKVASHWNKD